MNLIFECFPLQHYIPFLPSLYTDKYFYPIFTQTYAYNCTYEDEDYKTKIKIMLEHNEVMAYLFVV